MLRRAVPLGKAPSRFAVRASSRYSSSSPVHRAAAAASPALSQNASDTSEAAHSHGRTLYSHWNAVGNEPVTAETISALLSNSLSNLGVKDFLSGQECARMVDVIPHSHYCNAPSPQDKQTYFASVPSARELQERFIQEAKIDIVARVASYLRTVTNLPVRLACEGNQEYFAGLLRLINSSALVHADYGPYDAPGWEIGRISAQLSWNILLREVQGGECIIYRRFWEGKSDDERFKQPKPGYGYTAEAVEGREVQDQTIHKTVALYQQDETLRKHTTQIISVQPVTALSETNRALFKHAGESKDFVVVTAETIFYAQGGGQPSDTGKMTLSSSSSDPSASTLDVTSVRNGTDGQILHLGSFSPSSSSPFQPGDSVEQAIDSEKRLLNSRIHTGGHVVGLAVRYLSSSIPDVTELKAQHYPDLAFVDFKGSIDGKHKEAIQAQVDEYISQALPVQVYFWNEAELREKCAVVPEAVAIPEGELVRAVDIVGAGAYPCGGTHVPDTGKVGKVTIKKISRSKGNSKVSYVVS
ncbi:hypothetical protein N0V90_010002 [Kalmusia sp. IMI 367209]|nr:hypothetical protein N0V90_010002 [Kalmusia sp. IMI 367209]